MPRRAAAAIKENELCIVCDVITIYLNVLVQILRNGLMGQQKVGILHIENVLNVGNIILVVNALNQNGK